MIKLSVNETKWSSLLARTLSFIFFVVFRFENLISGPKSYRDVRETDPGFADVIFRREGSDERKYVCCSQAIG